VPEPVDRPVPVDPPPTGRMMAAYEAMRPPPKWAVLLVLAQDDRGDDCLPCVNRRHEHHPRHTGEFWWCRRYNPWNPAHWPYRALTWATGWIVGVEDA
jgi:hypothetical protein